MSATIRVTMGDLNRDYEILGTVSTYDTLSFLVKVPGNIDKKLEQKYIDGIEELKRRSPSGTDAIIFFRQVIQPFGSGLTILITLEGTAVSIRRPRQSQP